MQKYAIKIHNYDHFVACCSRLEGLDKCFISEIEKPAEFPYHASHIIFGEGKTFSIVTANWDAINYDGDVIKVDLDELYQEPFENVCEVYGSEVSIQEFLCQQNIEEAKDGTMYYEVVQTKFKSAKYGYEVISEFPEGIFSKEKSQEGTGDTAWHEIKWTTSPFIDDYAIGFTDKQNIMTYKEAKEKGLKIFRDAGPDNR